MAPLPTMWRLVNNAVIWRQHLYVSPGEQRQFLFCFVVQNYRPWYSPSTPCGVESGAPVTSACAPLSFQYEYDTPAHSGMLRFYFHSTTDSKRRLPGVRFPRHQPPPPLCPAASETATLATSVMCAVRPWQHRTG